MNEALSGRYAITRELGSGGMEVVYLAQAGLADSATAVVVRGKGDPSIDPTRDLLMIGAFAHTRMESHDEPVALLAEFIGVNPILAVDLTSGDYWWWWGFQDHPGFQELEQLGGVGLKPLPISEPTTTTVWVESHRSRHRPS